MKKRCLIIIIIITVVIFIIGYIKGIIGNPYNKINYKDLTKYESTVFSGAKGIWPITIDKNSKVKDYYLCQYTVDTTTYYGFLTVEYESDVFKQEKERLRTYNSSEYVGIYENTGIDKYEVLAMKANEDIHSLNGFTYALQTDDNTITYVEMSFYGDWLMKDVFDNIPAAYLPSNMQIHEY